MTQDYKVQLKDGSIITITGAERVEKDGAGLRFFGPEGVSIASFDDGLAKAHWPAGAVVEEPAAPEGEDTAPA